MEKLLSEDEVATLLHANKRFVQDMRRAGKLHPAKFGKHWLYKEREVADYIEHMFDLQNQKRP